MSTDFFDGLAKTLTKTTRELRRTTKELGARAEQTIEAQKIRNRIAGEEQTIEKIKKDIGSVIYKRHSEGQGLDGELSSLCQEIDRHYLKVREYRDNAAKIKGQKICPSCEKEVDIDVSFCPYCGTPCPTPEPAENVEKSEETVPEPQTETPEAEESEESEKQEKPEEEKKEEPAEEPAEQPAEQPAEEDPAEKTEE